MWYSRIIRQLLNIHNINRTQCKKWYWSEAQANIKLNLLTNWFNELRFQFPPLQTLGEDLVSVLNFLHVKYVICLGEGAGANVCARFGLAHPSKVIGMILINCTGSPASVIDIFKNKVSQNDTFSTRLYCCQN